MRQQQLQTVITLSGRVDNRFGKISEALINVGAHVDALSRKLIDFGKESVKEYVNYDDVMRKVQALGKYDSKTMGVLHEYNKAIAQTSKYTMEQAAQAEKMIAQLGLSMDQTKVLMPSVMTLATAANIDLATSLDYLYYSLNALGLPMESANVLSDQMSKTAAISAADIDTLGQSMQRLGSGAQFFAGGSSEVLAILGGIAQFGHDMQGYEVGTQLRNFMLTLLAPTKSKDDLIKSLKISEEEWAAFESYMDDAGINVTDTAEAMDELGLSVYDTATGELKPAVQIIGELQAALAGMSEADKNRTLGNLFGKRTTTMAMNLMAALDTIIAYQKEIETGSAGYTAAMAETMEGGLGGALREFTASWEAFQVTVGEVLAPTIEKVADWMTNLVNSIANMDSDQLDMLVSAATVVAGAGPALLVAGAAFRTIAFAMTPIGAATLGLIALTGAAGALHKLGQANFASQFGEMALDTETLLTHVNGISDAFNAAYASVDSYNTALETAMANYTTASTTLSGNLLTNYITGATLTDADKATLNGLGETIRNELLAGINAGFDSSAEYATAMYGGLEDALNDDSYVSGIYFLAGLEKHMTGEADTLGKELGALIGSAIDDGIVTGDEYNAILKKKQALNEAMAIVSEMDSAEEFAKQMHRAESVSWESVNEFLTEQNEIMQADIAKAEEEHAGQVGRLKKGYELYREKGLDFPDPRTGKPFTDETIADYIMGLETGKEKRVAELRAQNAKLAEAAFNALMSQSEYGDAWQFLMSLYADGDLKRDAEGNVTWDAVDWRAVSATYLPDGLPIYGEMSKPYEDMHGIWQLEHDYIGILSQMTNRLAPFLTDERLELYQNIFDDAPTIADYMVSHTTDSVRERIAMSPEISDFFAHLGVINKYQGQGWGARRKEMERVWDELGASNPVLQDEINKIIAQLAYNYDFERYRYYNVDTTFTSEDFPLRDIYTAYEMLYLATEDYAETYRRPAGEAVLSATVDAEGLDASARSATSSALGELYAEWGDPILTARVIYTGIRSIADFVNVRTYAEGGRATEASIFGEAGPEWAIPEEHTDRVARLFDKARAAAGFTWPELISRNGGLNAGGGTPAQLIYSPTIYAGDARGVSQALLEDKERFEMWWRERQMRNEVEVFA
jgi:hypothetical protein